MLWQCRSKPSKSNKKKANAPPLQAQIISLQAKLQALETRHQMEMTWRQNEEKCANELLQTQLDEIQVQLYPVGSTVRYEMMKLCDGSV